MRVCRLCLKQNLVSGSALYLDYGVDFTRNRLIHLLAGRVFFFGMDKKAKHIADHLSHNPADFQPPYLPGEHTFFWKPHLGALLDLPAAALRLRLARTLVPRITAAVRALFVRLVIGHNGRLPQLISSHCFFFQGGFEPERLFVAMYLPLHLGPVTSDSSLAARAMVQRFFLAHVSDRRLVLSRAAKTWSALMALEGARPGKQQPSKYVPRMNRMPPVDISCYRLHKELAVAPAPY